MTGRSLAATGGPSIGAVPSRPSAATGSHRRTL
jgi:hypothetical protein